MYCIWILSNNLDLNPETSFYYNFIFCFLSTNKQYIISKCLRRFVQNGKKGKVSSMVRTFYNLFKRLRAKLLQLLLRIRPATILPIVTLVKTFGGKTCLQKPSCDMMSHLFSNSLRLSVKPSSLVIDISEPGNPTEGEFSVQLNFLY